MSIGALDLSRPWSPAFAVDVSTNAGYGTRTPARQTPLPWRFSITIERSREFVLSQCSQYLLQVVLVVFHSCTVNEYIIQEDQNKFSQKWLQHLVHNALKGGRCIGEAKGHHLELVISLMGLESSFVLIFWMHSHLVVA